MPRLSWQFGVGGLAEDVEEQGVAFLDARGDCARNQQINRSNALGEATVAAQETDAFQLFAVRLFERSQDIA